MTYAMEDAEADSQTAVDEWAAYNRVAALPNVSTHLVVDDTYHFVDPTAGAHTHTHTQNVESYWGRIKTKLKRMKGRTANQLPRHFDEFMWKDRHGTTRCECNGQEGLFPVAFVEEL